MNPLGGFIFLLGAPLIAEALRTYFAWWAKRNFVVATAFVFLIEILLITFLAVMLSK